MRCKRVQAWRACVLPRAPVCGEVGRLRAAGEEMARTMMCCAACALRGNARARQNARQCALFRYQAYGGE